MNRWTLLALFSVAALAFTATSCRTMNPRSSTSISAAQPPQLLSETEWRNKIGTIIADADSLTTIRTVLVNDGFNARFRQNGDLWATKEVPAKFPTSMVYDVILTDTSGTIAIVRAEIFGKGP